MDHNSTDDRKINKLAFWPAIVILILFILAGVIWTEEVGAVMTKLLYGMADYFGAYINLLSLTFIILAVVFLIGRYGDVIIGGQEARPEYSMASWCAMSICSGIGTGLLFWAMGEPIFHFMQTPAAIGDAGSRRAGILQWLRPCGIGALCSTACMPSAERHLQSSAITGKRVYPLTLLWNVLPEKRLSG